MQRGDFDILVLVPFHSTSVPISHKRVAVRLIETQLNVREIPDWIGNLVHFIANKYKPSEVSDETPCEVTSVEIARYYLEQNG